MNNFNNFEKEISCRVYEECSDAFCLISETTEFLGNLRSTDKPMAIENNYVRTYIQVNFANSTPD